MTGISIASMTNYAYQRIIIEFIYFDVSLTSLAFLEMVEGVGMEIEFMREGMLGWYFLIYESIKVENNPLKMNDKDFWNYADSGSFCHIDFLLTKITLVVVNHLTQDISIEWVSQSFWILNLQSDTMEIFLNFFRFFTFMAVKEVDCFSRVEILDKGSEGCITDAWFQSIKEHWNEFLHILLNHNIDWLPKGFVGYTEISWHEINSVGSL